MKSIKLILSAATLLAVPLLTTGCSTSFNPTLGAGTLGRSTTPLSGKALGGQQPISGASIYLMAAGTGNNLTGYGAASTSLLSVGSADPNASTVYTDSVGNGYVLTDTSGGFDITGSFTCPAQNSQVYLVGQGGDAGSGPNSAINLVLALGSCGNLANQSYISLNELSTVAAVTALQQFVGSDVFHIGASNANLTGISNAMTMAGNLVNLNYGYVVPSSDAVTNPTAKIYTLGNAMASCVNSNGPGSGGCTAYFAGAYVPATSSTSVTDTFIAMLQIARYPSYNTQAIINAVPAASAFGNAMSVAPNDFALPVSYHGGGLGGPYPNNLVSATAVAIDGNGGAWIAACGVSCQGIPADSIIEINPYTGTYANGYILSGSGGFGVGSVHNTQSLAIDQSNAVYSVNDPSPYPTGTFSTVNSITVLGASGVEVTPGSPITNPSFQMLEGIALDASGHLYVTDFGANGNGGSVYSVTSTGTVNTVLSQGAQLQGPTDIGIDTNGDFIINDTGGSRTAIYTPSGNTYTQAETQAGGAAPTALVLTSGHNFWTLNPGNNTIYKLTEAGVLAPCPTGPMSCTAKGGSSTRAVPNAVSTEFLAIDGSSEVFVPACSAGCSGTATAPDSLAILTDTGAVDAYRSGLQDASLANPVGVAVDGSGNAWITNGNTGAVTEFVGIATPVATPLAFALQQGEIGIKP